MRKIIITSLLLSGCLATQIQTQAQSLSDLFKMFSTSTSTTTTTTETEEQSQETSTPTLSASYLLGEWNFTKLAVDLSDDSSLKGFAGSVAISQVESLLNSVASSSGISEGMFTISFINNSDVTLKFEDKQTPVNSIYSIDVEQNTISLNIGTVNDINIGELCASVKLSDSSATLLFDAKTLIAIADQIPDIVENSQYAMVKSVATSVDGLLLGFTIQKM